MATATQTRETSPLPAIGGLGHVFGGLEQVEDLAADLTLLWSLTDGEFGNLVYRGTSRNFNTVVGLAAKDVTAPA